MIALTPILGFLSAGGALLYLAYVLFFRYRTIPRRAAALDADTVTPADFTIQVDKLPGFDMVSAPAYATELKKHLGEVLKRAKAG